MYNKGPKEREKVKKEGENFGNFFFLRIGEENLRQKDRVRNIY
jgi:hypothetical protein